MRTDQWQLVAAYVGLHYIASALLIDEHVRVRGFVLPGVPAVLAVLTCVAIVVRLHNDRRLRRTATYREMPFLNYVIVASMALFVVVVISQWGKGVAPPWRIPPRPTENLGQITFAAVALPVLFQFVDVTNWQRIAALKAGDRRELLRNAQRGLGQFLVESPATWLIAILIGMSAAQVVGAGGKEDPWDALIAHFVSDSGFVHAAGGVLLCISVVAVFMSTADGLLTAIGYVWAYDVNRRSRRYVDAPSITEARAAIVVDVGRLAIAVVLGVVIAAFVTLDLWSSGAGMRAVNLFIAFFTPLVAFTPALLIPALVGRAVHPTAAMIAVCVSAGAGLLFGLLAAFGQTKWQWYPVPATVVLGTLLYAVGYCFGSRSLEDSHTVGAVVQGSSTGGQQ